MGNWLCCTLLALFFVSQLYGTKTGADALRIPPESLQTSGNGTALMPGREWRKDKRSCKAKPFLMEVGDSSCDSKKIVNHYCIGYCNSLYIPQYPRSNVRFCKACIPAEKVKKVIPLNCIRNGKKVVVLEEVTYIKNCQCVDVEC